MAKLIKLTPEYVMDIKKAFEEVLKNLKVSDGKINFTKTLGTIDRKANVYFTELAWVKMQTLIREFDKEVGWHGIATRGDDPTKDEYYITDILVYPQEVTGATVTTDQEEYQMWLMGHDDEVFNNIRMQGHSHVNMGVSPSSVDTSLYERILDQLEDNMFYIFMIWNKKGDKTIKIYDIAKNVLFDTSDCKVEVLDDGTGLERFLKDAKAKVKDRVYKATPATQKGNSVGNATKGYSGKLTEEKKSSDTKKKGVRKGKRTNKPAAFSNAWEKDDDYNSFYGDYGWQNNFDFWGD